MSENLENNSKKTRTMRSESRWVALEKIEIQIKYRYYSDILENYVLLYSDNIWIRNG